MSTIFLDRCPPVFTACQFWLHNLLHVTPYTFMTDGLLLYDVLGLICGVRYSDNGQRYVCCYSSGGNTLVL